ncbi:MAG: hypothetical protein WCJ18_02805, partial [Planctomycetota bacterium]
MQRNDAEGARRIPVADGAGENRVARVTERQQRDTGDFGITGFRRQIVEDLLKLLVRALAV